MLDILKDHFSLDQKVYLERRKNATLLGEEQLPKTPQ